jgi:hypothetical protein
MSEYLWVVGPIVLAVGLLSLAFAFFGYLRAKRPHSKKKAEEQEKLNKKQGASSGVPPTTTTIKEVGDNGKVKWLFVLAGVVLVFLVVLMWQSSTPPPPGAPSAPSTGRSFPSPTPEGVWEFFKNYWFWTSLILGGLFFAADALPDSWAKSAKGMVVAFAVLMAGAMAVHGIWDEKSPSHEVKQQTLSAVTRALPQNAPDLPRAWNADGTMTDPSKWPRVQVPPHGDSVRVPNVFGGHLVWGGSGFKVHCVYADGNERIVGDEKDPCSDGNIVSMYARNDGGTVLHASYAYAKMSEK